MVKMDKKNNLILKFFVCILLFLAYSGNSYGKDAASVDFNMSYFLDSTNRYTINDIISSNNFIPSKNQTLDFGFTQSAMWLSIDLKKNKDDLLITIENCHLDSIDIYFLSNNKLIKKNQSGDHLPFNSRYFENSFFNFLVEKGTDKIFVKIKTQGT